jgi:hypothetical protein
MTKTELAELLARKRKEATDIVRLKGTIDEGFIGAAGMRAAEEKDAIWRAIEAISALMIESCVPPPINLD